MRNIKNLKTQDEEDMLIALASDALAHPARIKIFRFIMNCNRKRIPVCNKDVVENMDYCQSTCSQHLDKLIRSGLVNVKGDVAKSLYFVNLGMLQKFLNATKNLQ